MSVVGLSRQILAACCVAVGLAGCGQPHKPGAGPSYVADAYLNPPSLVEGIRGEGGAVRLTGRAPADALVRLRSPDAGEATTHANANGQWSLELPPADRPRLYAFQAEVAGRVIRGEGAAAVMPAPAPAALLLRAGFAAVPAAKGTNDRLQLITLDFDGGGAAASGLAPPNAAVQMSVDGAVVGLAQADGQGRFGVLAVGSRRPITTGRHRVRVETGAGLAIERTAGVATPNLADDKVFGAVRTDQGWAVSWRLPGGGEQTSLVFDNAIVSGPPAPRPGPPTMTPKSAR